jgi:hypothetical protein
MKFLRVLSVVALVALLATSAYAETQNVKVSGDLGVYAFFRDNYGGSQSLTASPNENIQANGTAVTALGDREGISRSNSNWFMSITELQVDADLTDNVSTCIRLVNQRDWNAAKEHGYNTGTQVSTIGSGGFGHSNAGPGAAGYQDDPNEFAVDLELAYVTLKSFLYSPLTVTIGRQNLWFGKGFIVGANQRIRNAGNYGVAGYPQPIGAPEYTAQNAFDSVKAVLDFDPWTLTAIYSRIWQNDIRADDGLDLWGANVGYKFDAYNGEAEGYWFYKQDHQVQTFNWGNKANGNEINTIGLRGSFDPVDVWTLYAEFAGQFGSYVGNQLQNSNRARVAGALDVGADCRYFVDKWAWKPKVGVEFIWYSGDNENNATAGGPAFSSGQYHGWDPMFRGKTDSLIREFIGRYYYTAKYPFQTTNYYNSVDNSFQNQGQLIFKGSLQPMDSIKLTGNLNMFWNQYSYDQRTMKDLGYVGTEIDLGATWDYTEDVSFNVIGGWFVPGQVYYNDQGTAATAVDMVASVKVSF